jgi:hypothetical protein
MAPKPKGWKDNPLGEINKLYNAIMPGGRDVTQPQSLAQFKDVVRNTAAGTVKAADLYTTGGLGVSFAQNVIRPATTFSSPETRNAATSKGMTQFAKDAAITAASAGAGAVVGKAVSKSAGAIANSQKTYYGVHGSPTSNLTKIQAQIGKNTQGFNKNVKGMFGSSAQVTSPKVFSYKPEPENIIATTQYAQDAQRGSGSVYVVKTKAKNVSSNVVDTSKAASFMDSFAAQSLTREQMSSKTMKVVKELPVSNYTKRTYDAMEDGYEVTQNFAPMSKQISQAIQADKKFASSVVSGLVKGSPKTGAAAGVVAANKKKLPKKK